VDLPVVEVIGPEQSLRGVFATPLCRSLDGRKYTSLALVFRGCEIISDKIVYNL
jgi:hypothetical protein